METRDLGLFPLDLVLVPGERIPLHIFEPRYRQLYADCVLEDRPFVLVRAEEGVAAEIGCAARFEELLQRMEDGRLSVIVRGVEAVRIVEETEGSLYFSALCETLADEPGPVDVNLAEEVRTLYTELSKRVTGETRTITPDDGVPLSYAVAGAVEIAAPIKQLLLESRDENARMLRVIRAMQLALQAEDRADVAEQRAKTNGKVSH
ncbi:MAG: LON peptidase substrate-binding domain-containing protein [Thermoleophilia bacterium]